MNKYKSVIFKALPFIIFSFFLIIYGLIKNNSTLTTNDIIYVLGESIVAAFLEELVFRKWLLNEFIKKFGKQKYFFCIIITALIFGMMHLLNLSDGATVVGVIEQVISATLGGILLGLIYYNSGSFKFVVFLHFIYDVGIGFINKGNLTSNSTNFDIIGSGIYFTFLLLLITNFFVKNKALKTILFIIELILIIPIKIFAM